ncbi:unnamed protein product [Scytosiphon promiscuus]
MRQSLMRLYAGGKPSASAHRCMRRWAGPPLSAPQTRHQTHHQDGVNLVLGTNGIHRSLSSSSITGPSDHDIAELNEDIAGFVGDLGDPDFDAPPPPAAPIPPSARNRRRTSESVKDKQEGMQSIPSAFVTGPRRRLTLADHPSVPGPARHANSPTETFEAPSQGQTAQPAPLVAEDFSNEQGSNVQSPVKSTKSVLVLNGAACFIAGKLASTGEPRGVIMESMEKAAGQFNLSLSVCTSNREDKLLDALCEWDYDAVVYNPSGFGNTAQETFTTAATRGGPLEEAGSPQMLADSERDDTDSRRRLLRGPSCPEEEGRWGDQMRDSAPGQRRKRGDEAPRLGNGSILMYGLARARCPVVVVVPGDETTTWRRGPATCPQASSGSDIGSSQSSQLRDRGTISGLSGATSYRLAMDAVASMLDEAPRKR